MDSLELVNTWGLFLATFGHVFSKRDPVFAGVVTTSGFNLLLPNGILLLLAY